MAQKLCSDYGISLISCPLGIPILTFRQNDDLALFLVDNVQTPVWQTYHGIKVLCRHVGVKRPLAQAYAVCAVLPRPVFTNSDFTDLVKSGYTSDMVKFRQFIYQVHNW